MIVVFSAAVAVAATTVAIAIVAQPQQPHHNTGPMRAFRWLLGKGAGRQREGIKRIGGWAGRDDASDGNTSSGVKKPKAKIG